MLKMADAFSGGWGVCFQSKHTRVGLPCWDMTPNWATSWLGLIKTLQRYETFDILQNPSSAKVVRKSRPRGGKTGFPKIATRAAVTAVLKLHLNGIDNWACTAAVTQHRSSLLKENRVSQGFYGCIPNSSRLHLWKAVQEADRAFLDLPGIPNTICHKNKTAQGCKIQCVCSRNGPWCAYSVPVTEAGVPPLSKRKTQNNATLANWSPSKWMCLPSCSATHSCPCIISSFFHQQCRTRICLLHLILWSGTHNSWN